MRLVSMHGLPPWRRWNLRTHLKQYPCWMMMRRLRILFVPLEESRRITILFQRNNVPKSILPRYHFIFFKKENPMKKMLIVCIMMACMFCGCTPAQRGTATGAAIGAGAGAVTGAAVGAATDGSDEAVVTGAVVGGAAGAVVGGAIGYGVGRRY